MSGYGGEPACNMIRYSPPKKDETEHQINEFILYRPDNSNSYHIIINGEDKGKCCVKNYFYLAQPLHKNRDRIIGTVFVNSRPFYDFEHYKETVAYRHEYEDTISKSSSYQEMVQFLSTYLSD